MTSNEPSPEESNMKNKTTMPMQALKRLHVFILKKFKSNLRFITRKWAVRLIIITLIQIWSLRFKAVKKLTKILKGKRGKMNNSQIFNNYES